MGKYMYLWSLIATVSKNERLFKVRRPIGSNVHLKSGISKKWHEI